MHTTKTLLSAMALATLCATALADDVVPETTSTPTPVSIKEGADGKFVVRFDSMTSALNGVTVFGMNMLKNAPYSAVAVREHEQMLGDGNQIRARSDSTTYYRDSAGRTRQETRDADGVLLSVVIDDPVGGAAWTLAPDRHVASMVPMRGRTAAEARREDGETARLSAAAEKTAQKTAPAAGEPGRVRVVLPDLRPGANPALGAAMTRIADDAKWAAKAVTRDLGARDFNGIRADGKLRSYEIPAGAIGNRNAIVVSDETWFAPELQITVYTKHSDPRSGDAVFRLENLRREEPAAGLFVVPADYTVQDVLAIQRERAAKARAAKAQ